MNMSVQWLCMQESSIFAEVTRGLPCESQLCHGETLFQSTPTLGHSSCDVLVVELSDAHPCFDPYGYRLHADHAKPNLPIKAAWLGAWRCAEFHTITRIKRKVSRTHVQTFRI